MSSLYLMQKNKNITNHDHQLPSSNELPMSTRRISHYKATIGTTQHDDMLNRLWKLRTCLEDTENKLYHAERKGLSSFRHIFLGVMFKIRNARQFISNCILHLVMKNFGWGISQSSLVVVDDFRYHKHLLFWQPLPKRFAPVLIHG